MPIVWSCGAGTCTTVNVARLAVTTVTEKSRIRSARNGPTERNAGNETKTTWMLILMLKSICHNSKDCFQTIVLPKLVDKGVLEYVLVHKNKLAFGRFHSQPSLHQHFHHSLQLHLLKSAGLRHICNSRVLTSFKVLRFASCVIIVHPVLSKMWLRLYE